jgi:stearoyl-CoA desaturase (delta-9 desaturase)
MSMFNGKAAERDSQWVWNRNLYVARFLVFHLICLTAIWTGVTLEALAVCGILYAVRMFAVTAGYHRYFSHRTYKMNRVMQFIMAALAETSAQKGILWWASHHRHHHKHSDDPEDVHSPVQKGFWYSHVGWLFDPDWADTDDKRVKDLARYPELVWLDRWHILPPTILGVSIWWFFGWAGLVVGFFWSTVLCWHATFTINSLSHVVGSKRYDTGDESRNNWLLALITFGEGWHNNHHHYQASANQGFFWWEYDISYYVLKAMSWVGLVKDLRNPPEHVVADERHPAAQQEKPAKASADSGSDDSEQSSGDPESGWSTGSVTDTVQEIGLSAAQVSEQATRRVDEIKLAAAQRYDNLSEKASQQYAEFSEAASRKVEDIRESARSAQEHAGEQVERIVDSLQNDPKPATD